MKRHVTSAEAVTAANCPVSRRRNGQLLGGQQWLLANSGGSHQTAAVLIGQRRFLSDSGGSCRTAAVLVGRRRFLSDGGGQKQAISWRTAAINLLVNSGGQTANRRRTAADRRQSASWQIATDLFGRSRSASWRTAEVRRQLASQRTAATLGGRRRLVDGGRKAVGLSADYGGLGRQRRLLEHGKASAALGERRQLAAQRTAAVKQQRIPADGGGRPRSSRTAAVGQPRLNGGGRPFKSSNHKK